MKIVKSISGVPHYRDICNLAATDESVFNVFRVHDDYFPILEHVNKFDGKTCLQEIEKDRRFEREIYKKIQENDLFGGPITVEYTFCNMTLNISPTTLRYAKIANDILKLFPTDAVNSVIEIGVGYGGQCRVLDVVLPCETYTLFDIKPALRLAQRYLENFLLNNAVNFVAINEKHAPNYDLCISNYAFSELNRDTQDHYIEKIIKKSKMGYMIYNHISQDSYETYTAQEFAKIVNGFIIDEVPLTHPDNCIVIWGVDKTST